MSSQSKIYGKILLAPGLAGFIFAMALLSGPFIYGASAQQNDEQVAASPETPTPPADSHAAEEGPTIGPQDPQLSNSTGSSDLNDLSETPLQADDRETLLRQAAQAAFAQGGFSGQSFEVGVTNIAGDWALVSFRVNSADETLDGSLWEVYVGLGHWDGAAWSVAVEESGQFLSWLDQVPEELISVEARSYLKPDVSVASAAPGLWLPFPVGQTWQFLSGPYGSHLREAIDFGPFPFGKQISPNPAPTAPFTGRERDVTAAATGLVVDRDDNLLVLRHSGDPPWETGYYSLAEASNVSRIGQVVYQGQRIGAASREGNWDKGDHLRFWVRRHGSAQAIDGQVLSEWRVFQDNGYSVGQNAGRLVFKSGLERIDCRTVERFRLADNLCHVKHTSVAPDPLPAATILFDSITPTVHLDETRKTKVLIASAANLYGVQLTLTYAPTSLITVVDAFPGTPGIQVAPGSAFDDMPVTIIQNEVHTPTGRIDFAAKLQPPALTINGAASLLDITWRRTATGTVHLLLDEIDLTDPNDRNLPFVLTSTGVITIQSGFILQGQVALQGRNESGEITLTEGDRQLQTDPDGQFRLGVGHDYDLTLTSPGYLSTQLAGDLAGLGFADAETIDIGSIVLPGGEVTGDDRIDIFDLALIAGRYGEADAVADVNGDGIVNIFDLALSASNFGQQGPLVIDAVPRPRQ